jgi:hypothetical protein
MTESSKRSSHSDIFLRETELARRWRKSPRTMQRWREKGTCPAYLRLNGRVLYRLSDIEAYEAERIEFGGQA